MKAFTGTFRLIRLALRRDRIKLPAWVLAITAMVAVNIPAVTSLYGKDLESRVAYAATTAPSLISRIFGGPINGPNLGEIILNETFLFSAIAIAFMSTLAVVRHTRQNEETGRAELIGSGVVGRHASLTAALLVAIGANVMLFLLLAGAFIGGGLPAVGSLGAAAALSATGIAFAGVAAVTAQAASSARGANSLAATGIGIAFLLRAAGDSTGQLTADRLGVMSAWPSWLSPIGWGQQLHPFTDEKWWTFGLYAVFFAVVTIIAFYCNTMRDVGLGMIPARKGPARAAPALLSIRGLARRLQRGVLIGWAVGVGIMGITMGLVTKEFAGMFENNPEALEALGQIGGGAGQFQDIFFAAMFALMGIAIGGYAVQTLQRMRSEENAGLLEPILSTKVSRASWMLSHIAYTVFGIVSLLVITGLTCGLTYALVTDAAWSELATLTGAALAQAPAILALAGFTVLCFGLIPRAVVALSWSTFAFCFLIGQFGELLKLPRTIINISPFSHTPAVPATDVSFLPITLLLAASVILTTAGIILFRRRDITTG